MIPVYSLLHSNAMIGLSLLIGSVWTIIILLTGIQSQNVPCTTPAPSPKLAKYITRAACALPGVERSICCEPQEVSPCSTAEQNLLSQDCGKTVFDRVAHGNVTLVFTYPWMAVVRYNEGGRIFDGCGGSLINERYVLTAAHCIKPRSSRKLHSVILGEHTKGQEVDCEVYYLGDTVDRDCADTVEEYSIESSEFHSDYNRPKYNNDIGLIRLDRNVIMKDHIQPICLPVTADLQKQIFDKYILTGWGTTENGTASDILLKAFLPRVDNRDCQQILTRKRLNIQLGSKQMCAGGKGLVDACKGDSGGPLGTFANHQGTRFVQYGIVTTGIGSCGQNSVPGVYSRVADYMDWILEKMQPNC